MLVGRRKGALLHAFQHRPLCCRSSSRVTFNQIAALTSSRVESGFALAQLPPARLSPSLRTYSTPSRHSHTMATDIKAEKLAKASMKSLASVKHAAATSPAAWREALLASGSTLPDNFQLTKTLVFKPKTAKNATPVPVVIIAREETETSSAAVGKKLGLKELRLAAPDLLTEFFKLDKDSRTS